MLKCINSACGIINPLKKTLKPGFLTFKDLKFIKSNEPPGAQGFIPRKP